MAGATHIVGAGIAGLSAALAASRLGRAVTLYEAAPHPGGRCRTIRPPDGFAHDNGTHVLFTANRRALELLDTIGSRRDWIEPEPEGLPVYDAASGRFGRVGLSPWIWLDRDRRPDGLAVRDLPRLLRLALPLSDRPVSAIAGSGALARNLIEPLTVAVLNTPMAEASSRRLGIALRRLARPGAARLLVARRGLGPDLVEPAVAALLGRDVRLMTGRRLHAVDREGDRATALRFADRTIPLAPEDHVILALPPQEIGRLLPELPVPDAFEPILNVHFRCRGPARPRFVGLTGSLAQWALLREDHASVTVSAARGAVHEDSDNLAARIWQEIAPVFARLGLLPGPAQPDTRVVKEKRATIRQAVGAMPSCPVRLLANAAIAGDWTGALPATIESAVVSGEQAVRALSAFCMRPADANRSATVELGGAS